MISYVPWNHLKSLRSPTRSDVIWTLSTTSPPGSLYCSQTSPQLLKHPLEGFANTGLPAQDTSLPCLPAMSHSWLPHVLRSLPKSHQALSWLLSKVALPRSLSIIYVSCSILPLDSLHMYYLTHIPLIQTLEQSLNIWTLINYVYVTEYSINLLENIHKDNIWKGDFK